ncbi:hypothetical protein Tco_0188561 [Tanacetum coccineum]
MQEVRRTSYETLGTHEDEARSSRSKRSRQHSKKQCSHVFTTHFCYGKDRVVNNMGCAEEIENMLEIKVYETGSQEEIFSSEARRRVFNINELIYTELCHEFYLTYEFDEVCANHELRTKKVIKFRLCGHAHSLTLLEFT